MTKPHPYDSILDELFHGCAAAAFVDEAIAQQGWPDCEATRKRAFRYYEAELAARHQDDASPRTPSAHSDGHAEPVSHPGATRRAGRR